MTREDEIAAVKLVGDKIGYGNLMSIAGALWRRMLREEGYPESGAFYPTCPSFIDKEIARETRVNENIFNGDNELDNFYGPATAATKI